MDKTKVMTTEAQPPLFLSTPGHRTIYRNDLHKMDVAYRRLLRSVVGPPRNMDWTLPWHEDLHIWNERVKKK